MKVKVLSRFPLVPVSTAMVLSFLTAGSAVAQTPPQHVGTATIAHTTGRDAGIVLSHLQQQLVRVTGVATPRETDVETLGRALDAARTRPIKPQKMAELSEALAAALGTGVFEEVTLQRLAEDLFAVLNNKALSADQAALVAVDVSAVMQDLGVAEPRTAVVLTALKGVCPSAVATPQSAPDADGTSKTPARRSLLILSRDSSE